MPGHLDFGMGGLEFKSLEFRGLGLGSLGFTDPVVSMSM